MANQINQLYPESAKIHISDVTNEDDVGALAQYVKNTYGDLHVLINNAGGSYQSTIRNLSIKEWDRVLTLNLRSVFLVSKLLGNLMISAASVEPSNHREDRTIVNVASLSGYKAGAQITHYSASKAAVINL